MSKEERMKELEKKRMEVLKEIKPICEAFNLKYDYIVSTEGQTETLVLNGQKIGCSCNSILAIKLEKQYEKLYEEVSSIIEKKFEEFEVGDSVGNIVNKKEIPEIAQKNKDGTYTIYHQIGEDWGNGIIYFPLENDEYLEIYYST